MYYFKLKTFRRDWSLFSSPSFPHRWVQWPRQDDSEWGEQRTADGFVPQYLGLFPFPAMLVICLHVESTLNIQFQKGKNIKIIPRTIHMYI